ncbi:protein SPIRAL1-like 1 [Andrographis paniculata]|uniref:protein SPIRAL1-like 1 n=1 Tax=Andrographis paniculata TaxID=175694 RepID=UPI0021E8CADA|nr:protein SPIRAL1-like 1 [Andrographis paniculata]
MGRGVSYGGGQSSLGYLFGSSEATPPKPAANNAAAPPEKSAPAAPSVDATKQIPAGIPGSQNNNYHRADGQNTGNFLTDRPSTKVHAAPGGGSSLGYLFGDGK